MIKITQMFALALCAALTLSLAACGNAAESQPRDGGVAVVNPLVSVESLEALNQKVALKMALPEGTQDASFHVLDKDIAQANFTVDGVKYTLRGTMRTENVAGVYGDSKEIGSFDAEADGKKTTVKVISTAESGTYSFGWNKVQYTLVVDAAVESTDINAGSGKVALLCAVACA